MHVSPLGLSVIRSKSSEGIGEYQDIQKGATFGKSVYFRFESAFADEQSKPCAIRGHLTLTRLSPTNQPNSPKSFPRFVGWLFCEAVFKTQLS